MRPETVNFIDFRNIINIKKFSQHTEYFVTLSRSIAWSVLLTGAKLVAVLP